VDGPFLLEGNSLKHYAKLKVSEDKFMYLLKKMEILHDAKKHDYTAGSSDSLYNYRNSAKLAGIKTEQTIFSRMCEKIMRISSIMSKKGETKVSDETITDTCLDIAIIALLLIEAFEEDANVFDLSS